VDRQQAPVRFANARSVIASDRRHRVTPTLSPGRRGRGTHRARPGSLVAKGVVRQVGELTIAFAASGRPEPVLARRLLRRRSGDGLRGGPNAKAIASEMFGFPRETGIQSAARPATAARAK